MKITLTESQQTELSELRAKLSADLKAINSNSAEEARLNEKRQKHCRVKSPCWKIRLILKAKKVASDLPRSGFNWTRFQKSWKRSIMCHRK